MSVVYKSTSVGLHWQEKILWVCGLAVPGRFMLGLIAVTRKQATAPTGGAGFSWHSLAQAAGQLLQHSLSHVFNHPVTNHLHTQIWSRSSLIYHGLRVSTHEMQLIEHIGRLNEYLVNRCKSGKAEVETWSGSMERPYISGCVLENEWQFRKVRRNNPHCQAGNTGTGVTCNCTTIKKRIFQSLEDLNP